MKKQRVLILALLCVVIFSALSSCSFGKRSNVPDQTDVFYVYDEANVLDTETKTYIVGKNVDLYEKCGGQIVVACVNTTGNYDIKDYAYAMFNKWKIGSADKNNGVLILLSIDEDDYWVLQGNGLENLLQSGTLKLMLNDYLEPYFAKKQYDKGVRALFDALIEKYEQIYSVSIVQAEVSESSVTQPTQQPTETKKKTTFWGVISLAASIIVIFTVVVIVLFIVISIAVTIFIIIGSLISAETGGGNFTRTFRSSGGININPHSARTSSYRGGTSFGGFTGSFGSSHHSGGFSSGSHGGFSSGSHGGFSGGSHGGGFSGGHHSGGGGFSRGGGAGRR